MITNSYVKPLTFGIYAKSNICMNLLSNSHLWNIIVLYIGHCSILFIRNTNGNFLRKFCWKNLKKQKIQNFTKEGINPCLPKLYKKNSKLYHSASQKHHNPCFAKSMLLISQIFLLLRNSILVFFFYTFVKFLCNKSFLTWLCY